MLDQADRVAAADLLWNAQMGRAPVAPLTETFPGIDVVDAYEIQRHNVRRQCELGDRVRGHKVGLSSPVMQQMMGVDEPDYGHLLDSMVLGTEPDGAVDLGRYCYPRIEVEIGYVLAESLPGEGCTKDDVLAATEYVVPALELIDSRILDWRIGLADTIADNASSGGVVLGTDRVRPGDLDLAAIDAVLLKDGNEVDHGSTSAVLGDPTTAVAWLGRKLADFGVKLEAGHLVLPGSCTRAVDVAAGDELRADFAGVGSVTVRFRDHPAPVRRRSEKAQ